MQEIVDQNNSEYGHFTRRGKWKILSEILLACLVSGNIIVFRIHHLQRKTTLMK